VCHPVVVVHHPAAAAAPHPRRSDSPRFLLASLLSSPLLASRSLGFFSLSSSSRRFARTRTLASVGLWWVRGWWIGDLGLRLSPNRNIDGPIKRLGHAETARGGFGWGPAPEGCVSRPVCKAGPILCTPTVFLLQAADYCIDFSTSL
jgi:hypothetical protein